MTQILPWPVQSVAEWMPLWKAAGFFCATFILEDAAAIGAGLLLAAGGISWPAAFVSCFCGIWLGDVGLYSLARFGGRKWFEQSGFQKHADKVARSEDWFRRRGTWMLVFSRCLPGTRLPTYLAAGFLRWPAPNFLLVTAAAAFAWTALILWLTQILGASIFHWLDAGKQAVWHLVGAAIVFVAGFQCLRHVARKLEFTQIRIRAERLRHWEFWPAWFFYPPVMLYCLGLAIKYRGFNLPTAANPGIFSGGLVGESKMEMLHTLIATSPQYTAEAGLVAGPDFKTRLASLDEQIARLRLAYPYILKPDLGQRGDGVKLIRTREQAENYLRQCTAPLVVQKYAAGPYEAGIFYYRFPHETRGRIFAITEKVFPAITGDGSHTVGELIRNDPRARLVESTYHRRLAKCWDYVLPVGEHLRLVESGNHAQGCIFKDGMRWNTPELTSCIDDISQKLGGFFVGRYDIRFADEAELTAGKNFQIIELNGAASEATSIYDARNSVWTAYRTLFRQWDLVFAIGAANRKLGHTPASIAQVWKAWRSYQKLAANYPVAD